MDPATCITIATLAYDAAIVAWSKFRDAVNYPEDSADLIIQLELERFRLQTWGRNAGLAANKFEESLHPVFFEVRDRLNRIEALFNDTDALRERFGLTPVQESPPETDKARNLIVKMRRSIWASGIKLDQDPNSEAGSSNPTAVQETTELALWRRTRWALRDKRHFQVMVAQLESHTNKLNQILTESQQKSASQQWNRINIVVVGNIEDEQSLNLIQKAVLGVSQLDSLAALVERKAISLPQRPKVREIARRLELHDFIRPSGASKMPRHLARNEGGEVFLFEKKSYPSDLAVRERNILKERIERLVLLLSTGGVERALKAQGYIFDPGAYCWWLVFRIPVSQTPAIQLDVDSAALVSLNVLFQHDFRPPLELRLRLASRLANACGDIFSSSWMHKSIRSDNILFLRTYDPTSHRSLADFRDLLSPYISGFEYSRQETEAQSVDKAKRILDLSSAIYRHPNYQGEAAGGYKMHFDIYSFGLVLAEIAFWVPLISFLKAQISSDGAEDQGHQVLLRPDMEHFHKEEAIELGRRVLWRVNNEMAFRVGTKFRDAVRWCLTFAGRDTTDEEDEKDWHPALEFNDRVVVALQAVAAE